MPDRSPTDNAARSPADRARRPVRRVTAAHLRALTAPSPRITLVLHDGALRVVDPESGFGLVVEAGARLLCTAADLRDSADAFRAVGARDAVAATDRDLTAHLPA